MVNERIRLNRYRPTPLSWIKDRICDWLGHRRIWGPRKGDGAVICVFCNTFIRESKGFEGPTEKQRREKFLRDEMNL